MIFDLVPIQAAKPRAFVRSVRLPDECDHGSWAEILDTRLCLWLNRRDLTGQSANRRPWYASVVLRSPAIYSAFG